MVLIIQDQFTHWIQGYPAKEKTTHKTHTLFQNFLGPFTKAKYVHTDGSMEFQEALDQFEIPHDASTPYRPETNGVAERAVRIVKEGTACTIAQSGWQENWWTDAMRCYCFLRNVTDVVRNGRTPFQARYGQPYQGPKIQFGALVHYKPSPYEHKHYQHDFGPKTVPGIFMGYIQKLSLIHI